MYEALITIVIGLVIIGLVLYGIGFLPIDPKIKSIIHAVIIVAVVLWLLLFLLRMAPSFKLP